MTIQDQISRFNPISLEEMDSIRLMNRLDTKYLTDTEILGSVLEDAFEAGYSAFEVDGLKISPYDSIYFDTDDIRMFQAHHDKRLKRQKVRTRQYVSSGLTFLEIKKKDNHGRTKKKRIEIAAAELEDFTSDENSCNWLDSRSTIAAAALTPSVRTAFKRITLVNPELSERLTIDIDVRFFNFRTGVKADVGKAVIIELKQDGRAESQMKRILLQHRVKPYRISKYCIGLTMTDPSAKSNRFREKVRTIKKINNKLDTQC